jgi:hypothetical protein
MHEDVNSVSPTLGFIIKTIDFQGYSATRNLLQQLTGQGTNSTSGMSEGRKQFGHTGETTLKRQIL